MVPTDFDSRIVFSNPAPGSRSKVVPFDGFANNDQSQDIILQSDSHRDIPDPEPT